MSYDEKRIKKRNRSYSRSKSPIREDKRRYKEKSKKSDRDRDRERDKDRERERDRDRNRERERDRDRDRDRERERSYEREKKSSRKDRDESDKKVNNNNNSNSNQNNNNNFNQNEKEKEKNVSIDSVAKVAAMISQKALSAERDAEEKEAEQAALEEEMRKRRERVKAWQLEKAARLAAESQHQHHQQQQHNNNNENKSDLINQDQSINLEQILQNGNGNEQEKDLNYEENNGDNNLELNDRHNASHWTLEDDDDDDEENENNNLGGEYTSNEMELEKNNDNNFIEPEEIKLLGPLKKTISDQEDLPLPFSSPNSYSRPRSGSGLGLTSETSISINIGSIPNKLVTSITTPTKTLNSLPLSPLIEKKSNLIDVNIKKPAASRFSKLSQTSPLINNNNVDSTPTITTTPIIPISTNEPEVDPLDAFMASLYDSGDVMEQNANNSQITPTSSSNKTNNDNIKRVNPFGSNFITLDEIMGKSLNGDNINDNDNDVDNENDTKSVQEWESEISFSPAPTSTLSQQQSQSQQMDIIDNDEEREEKERREFLEALKASVQKDLGNDFNSDNQIITEKVKSTEGLGRVFGGEGDMIDESEVESKKKSVLELLEEAKRGKELKPIDHSQIEYIPFRKNLYIVPRSLAKLAQEEVSIIREALQIKVRGKGCPAPVENWDQCGLSEKILSIIHKHNFIAPFSIQKQAIPAIMCGRDIIAVAKTGSGKTLAFLLPLFRHILDQPPLRDNEGPIGLIMAPARELAFQITNEAKKFTKALGIRVACIYGGAGVADQIADLKRGAEIVVCTPGRMIDILCMQAGKLVTLKRVTFVVMDEADRMFDMGFEPQIRMIIQNVRPDRQTVLFSATFPKQIEKLAKSILRLPLEIVVGERTTANKDITQYVEVHEEEEKYMRLLQLLGLWYERGSVLIFVDKQEKCDQLFQDLLKSGYPCLSLHGGKDQLDRDHTLHEFKTGIKTVMIATSVAGRGLDVPEIICVINYNCPNHVEDYVHRVGRTGRAGRKGVAYTFLLPSEDQYAPMMKTILEKAEQTVPNEIEYMVTLFKEKVAKGEAHWIGSGFVGKGFKFDASEMNEAQKLASMQRRAYEIEQGIISEKGDDDVIDDDDFYAEVDGSSNNNNDNNISNNNSGGGDIESKNDNNLSTSSIPLQITDGIVGTSLPSSSSLSSSSSSTSTAASTLSSLSSLSASISASGETPLERARMLALSLGINRNTTTSTTTPTMPGMPIIPALPPPPVTVDGKIDTKAALNRAKLIAAQMAGKGMTVSTGDGQTSSELHFMEEFEINDYPPLARRKVTQKNVLEEITYRTSVAIISRGSYIPPGKKLEPGERKLYLLIEGSTEMHVKQAKMEIQRLLEEETIKMGSVSLSNYGKYGII